MADKPEPKPYGNSKPISLHPLSVEEALRRAMNVPAPQSDPPAPKSPSKPKKK